MTQDEATRIAQAINEIIENSKTISDFKRELNWLKDNILGSASTIKTNKKGEMNR